MGFACLLQIAGSGCMIIPLHGHIGQACQELLMKGLWQCTLMSCLQTLLHSKPVIYTSEYSCCHMTPSADMLNGEHVELLCKSRCKALIATHLRWTWPWHDRELPGAL